MNRRAALSLAGIAALRAAAPTLAQTPTASPTPVRPGLIGGSALDALQKGENGKLSVARLSPAYTRNDSKVGIVANLVIKSWKGVGRTAGRFLAPSLGNGARS
jgi:hypothetical protein